MTTSNGELLDNQSFIVKDTSYPKLSRLLHNIITTKSRIWYSTAVFAWMLIWFALTSGLFFPPHCACRSDEKLELQWTLEGHQLGVVSVDISHNGAIAASSSLDAHIRLWDLESGKQIKSVDAGPGKRGPKFKAGILWIYLYWNNILTLKFVVIFGSHYSQPACATFK